MTNLTSTNKPSRNEKSNRHKNIILIFGICISLIAISSFFTLPEAIVTNGLKSNEKASKIHEMNKDRHASDTVLLINHNKKIHHNFLASYLLQESGLERKSQISAKRNGIFSEHGGRFIVPMRQLFGFH